MWLSCSIGIWCSDACLGGALKGSRWYLWPLLYIICYPSWAAEALGRVEDVLSSASYYEDLKGLKVDEVARLQAEGHFKPTPASYLQLGFTRGPVWLYFRIPPAGASQTRLLVINNALLDRIELFVDHGGRFERLWLVGDTLPYAHRPILAPGFVLPIMAGPDASHMYLKLSGESMVRLGLLLADEPGYLQRLHWQEILRGVMSGIVWSVALLALLAWGLARDALYGWFFAYAVSMHLTGLIGFGHAYRWWPDSPDFQQMAISLAVAASGISYLRFARVVLGLAASAPRVDLLVKVESWLLLLFLLLVPFMSLALQTFLAVAINSMAIAITLMWAWWCAAQRSGEKHWLFGASVLLMSILNWLQMPAGVYALIGLEFTLLLFQLALSLNIALFAITLAYRFMAMREQAVASERQALRAVLQHQIKGDFMARMSHEIRTPLNGVMGMAQLLWDTPLNATQRKYLEMINSSGQMLADVVSDIADYTSIESGRVHLVRESFSVDALLEDLRRLFFSQSQEKPVRLLIERSTDVPLWLEGDLNRLRQVLVNLLSNAFKYTEQGQVTLGLSVDNGRLCFAVSDTGMGISPENQRKLFEHFEQLDASTARRFGGTGLGLAICRQLVELMGGQIGVSSQLGAGSTFSFGVPLVLAQAAGGQAAEVLAADRQVVGGLRVLVAEDNDINWLVTRGLLQKLGHSAIRACDGAEALRLLEGDARVDLVLMDCEMPVMDGLDATRRIRAAELSGHLPVIALTAHATEDYRLRCLAVGMDECLVKPVTLEVLWACLNRYAWLNHVAREP